MSVDLKAIREGIEARKAAGLGAFPLEPVESLLDYTEALIAALREAADYLSQDFFTREEFAFAEKLRTLLPPEPQR